MKTLRVRDIMSTDIHTLQASASVADAARELGARGISGAPVIDRGRIVGVVSKSDLIDPQNWPSVDGQPSVDAVMTRVVFAVRPGDPVMSAVRLMVSEKIHRAVVVSDEGALVGVVTPMDVLRALAEGDAVQQGDYALEARHELHADPEVAVGYVDLRTLEMTT
ncbi:MAG TPA: CBS domain-containing protein [Candidatus Nanopelagicales bacterium]|nr:CBS domain-containing protein [Candidatus Nanopelagicales bacterium]